MLITRIRAAREPDDGIAMAGVVGLMAVGLILTSLIMTSMVSATAYTSNTRAGVQSQAAAEAGIAAAQARLLAGTCATTIASTVGTTPKYSVTVQRKSGSAWVDGCPSGTTGAVRLVSIGNAQAAGVAGASGQDTTRVEAILDASAPPTQITASGPAVYAFSSDGFGGSGRSVSVDGSSPDIMVKQGNVTCDGAANGDADLVVDGGNLNLTGSCTIKGNVWVSGIADMGGGGKIDQNVVAAEVKIPNGRIGGNVWATGAVTMSGGGKVIGNVSAGSFTSSVGDGVQGNGWVTGEAIGQQPNVIRGNLTAKKITRGATWFTKIAAGTETQKPGGTGASPWATPARPVVPNWIDFGYDASKWVGFQEVTLSGTCDYNRISTAIAGLNGQNGLLDARLCTSPVNLGSYQKITLNQDVAIVGNKFDFGGSAGFQASAKHRLWFIIPDTVNDAQPTCNTSTQSFSIGGGFELQRPNVQTMIYSPCSVNISSSTTFNGQVFAGKASMGGAGQIGYVAVGLPGVNLDTGSSDTVDPSTLQRQLVSQRNLGG